MNWEQVAPLRSPRERRPLLLPWLLGALPVLVWSRELASPTGWWRGWVLPVGLVCAGLLNAVARRPRYAVPLAGIGVTLVVVATPVDAPADLMIGATAVGGTLFWGLALAGLVRPSVAGSTGRIVGSARVAAPAVGVGDVLVLTGPFVTAAAVTFCVAGLLAILAFAAGGHRVERIGLVDAWRFERVNSAVERAVGVFGRLVGAALGSILTLVPATLVSMLWLVHRLLGLDPLAAPVAAPGFWVRRAGSDARPERYVSSVRAIDPLPRTARLARAGEFAVVAAVVATIASQLGSDEPRSRPTQPDATVDGSQPRARCTDPPLSDALADQPFAAELECERAAAFARGEFVAGGTFRLADYRGDFISVRDGVRATWTPPPCTCRRLRVWWFGGSAAWGEGQRDEWTLPSAFARAAWERGIALDIENRAMPTYTLGQGVRTLLDLSDRTLPDLIVFYDGANDVVFQGLRALRGRASDPSDLVLMQPALDDLFAGGLPVSGESAVWTPAPDDSALDDLTSDRAAAEADAILGAVLQRVERNVAQVELLAEGLGVEWAVAWQPISASAPTTAVAANSVDSRLAEFFGGIYDRVRASLPAGVVDVADGLDTVDSPVFYDLFHTNERGAVVMGDVLFRRLAGNIERASARSSQGPDG